MLSYRRCLNGIALLFLVGFGSIFAAPPLTTVQDILFNADGTKFNGTATISWNSFEASDMSNIPAHSFTTQIVNGLVRVQLVPTTNALSPASYTVVYNSDGSTQFTESWAVPPSNVPLRVRDIRIGGPGSIIGGGGNPPPPPILTGVNIADVVGLVAALNTRATIGTGFTPSRAAVIDAAGALDGAIGNAADCLHVDGSSAACGGSSSSGSGPTFVDGEVPTGSLNGVNAAFLLGNIPSPATSVYLYRNGLLMRQGTDYSLTNSAVTFGPLSLPQPNDILLASYRMGTNSSAVVFVDGEIPSGTVDGSNTAFTLSLAPNPPASLQLYRNGIHLRSTLDYTASGASIVFVPGQAPRPGDVLVTSYRR